MCTFCTVPVLPNSELLMHKHSVSVTAQGGFSKVIANLEK